ncbi:MAG TPA: HD-GYP domain-containing protein [Solirubrobacteraceae bacterium]|nr:HD-GYP domain-containing protein [Solirubrobacteraceae bacterium]
MHTRKTWVVAAESALCAGAIVAAALLSRAGDWNPWPLPLLLLALAIASDQFAIETRRIRISATHFSLVVAMVLLGPAPAVAIGLASTLVDSLRSRPPREFAVINLATYSAYPLLGAVAFHGVEGWLGFQPDGSAFLLLVFGVYLVTNVLNFLMVVTPVCALDGVALWTRTKAMFIPLIPAEMAIGLLAVGVVAVYESVGLNALVLCTIVVFTFQYLLRELLTSQTRAEALEVRGKQLASLQLGVISALMHTLDLRDRMTARHCAAVARYSREIAKELGLPESEQELVHTAGLLHDIGKFVFPDHILKADVPLTERDWQIIRSHPYQGAKIVSQVDGYGPISDIVLAHHERWDGGGYPRRLAGEDIPLLSRIISVADTYDVMTARDTYREPVSSMEAMRELQRVSGAQLDPQVVDAFISLLARNDVAFRHGDNADFDAELRLEDRVREYAQAPRLTAEP